MSPERERSRPVVAVIDDEEDIVTYLRLAFEDHGMTVVNTSDPAGAMELLGATEPDLICLDLLMPGRTGMTLYAELAAHSSLRRCPIVIMSGLAGHRELESMMRLAGPLPAPAAILEKPIDIDQLLELADRLLEPGGGRTAASDGGGSNGGGAA